jgi:hypothetical protein
MDCFIKYNNGIIIPYNEIYSKENIDKIYYQDKYHKYGFCSNNKFFIDNCILDFKISILPFEILVYKSNKINFNTNEEELTYNIGYSNNGEKYILSINKEIYLIANKDNIEKRIKVR